MAYDLRRHAAALFAICAVCGLCVASIHRGSVFNDGLPIRRKYGSTALWGLENGSAALSGGIAQGLRHPDHASGQPVDAAARRAERPNDFQDRCRRPLGHLSAKKIGKLERISGRMYPATPAGIQQTDPKH